MISLAVCATKIVLLSGASCHGFLLRASGRLHSALLLHLLSPLRPRPEPRQPSTKRRLCLARRVVVDSFERSQASTAVHPATLTLRRTVTHRTRVPYTYTPIPRTGCCDTDRNTDNSNLAHDLDAALAAPSILHPPPVRLAAITPSLASPSSSRLTVSRDLRNARARLISSLLAQPRPPKWRQKYACSTTDRLSKPLALHPVRPCNTGASQTKTSADRDHHSSSGNTSSW